jgi:medium-chain acyl-[acyl-carrier-protein] hydrolase
VSGGFLSEALTRRRPVSFMPDDWVAPQLVQQLGPHSVALFCFPFAGGAASVFRRWNERMPAGMRVLPVQLPGRENRWQEAAYMEVGKLVVTLAAALQSALRPPFALFGHSMGALIAFELARELRRLGRPGPVRLFVSACRAPHIPDPDPPVADLPHDEFLSGLQRLHGVPDEVLQNDEMMALVLPTLRADFRMCETYAWRAGEPLDCPISAFGGMDDRKTRHAHLSQWRTHTRAAYVERLLPGDHLFLGPSRAALIDAIATDLTTGPRPP